MELKGSKTEQNLLKALAGESMARNKYNWFASQARKDGYEQIAAIFDETAGNEKEHAKLWFKALDGIGNTEQNLLTAASGENEEWSELYPAFAKVAEEEGFSEIATVFKRISEVEKFHESRYNKLIENIQNNKVFKKDEVVLWKCTNCGYLFEGEEAPKLCPACAHPQSYFEVHLQNI